MFYHARHKVSNGWDNFWNGTYDFYDQVCALRDEIEKQIKNDQKSKGQKLPAELLHTAKQFAAKLRTKINEFEISSKGNQDLADLIFDTSELVFDYEPKLIYAHDLGNQIKAFINNCLAKVFNAKPWFNTDLNVLAESQQQFKFKYDVVRKQIQTFRDKLEDDQYQACADALPSWCKSNP